MKTRHRTLACIGDSLTYGLGSSSAENAYPARLQQMLGAGARVRAFGHCGATVIRGYPGDDRCLPYVDTPAYLQAKGETFDAAVFCLGMNDCNPTHSFLEQSAGEVTKDLIARYRLDYRALISQLCAPHCRIFLCTLTPMRRTAAEGWPEDYVRKFVHNTRRINRAVAALAGELEAPLIDLQGALRQPAMFADGIHLTDSGYCAMAEIIYCGIKPIIWNG